MSESAEMYLVMTALLRKDRDEPVPVSLLANKLTVSPVSANEMCRKLTERGLISYQPYKGVMLTAKGEAEAQLILSRRRLWVVFLVENLGIEPHEADEIACELEHITSERLVNALKAFVEQAPAISRQRSLLRSQGENGAAKARPLSACSAGARSYIARIMADPLITDFLRAQGVVPGTLVEVLTVGNDGALLLSVGGHSMTVAHSVAACIEVTSMTGLPATRPCTWEKCSAFWACVRQNHECTCDVAGFYSEERAS